jgi:hypothetical protein
MCPGDKEVYVELSDREMYVGIDGQERCIC